MNLLILQIGQVTALNNFAPKRMHRLCIMTVAILAALIAMQYVDHVAAQACEAVSVPDGPCNGKEVGSQAFFPSPTGTIFCEIIDADCFRFDGFSCTLESCQVYLPTVGPFRGWRLGASNDTCNDVCGGTVNAPIGCNPTVSAQVIGIQTTVNLLNILEFYTIMNASQFKLSSARAAGSGLPSGGLTTVLFVPIAVLYYRVDSTTFDCAAFASHPVCCCSSNPADCLLPTDPQYNVPWPIN